MKFLNWVLVSYLLIVLLLIHSSLFFCGGTHCIITVERPPLPAELAYRLRLAISSLLPYELKTMQAIAQWLVLGQIMMLLLWITNLIRKLLCNCWILLILVAAFTFFIVAGNRNVIDVAADIAQENGIFTGEQINEWGAAVNRSISELKGLVK